jgi:hypothetical protein
MTGSPNKDIKESGPTQDYVAQPSLEQYKNVEYALRCKLFGGTRDNPAAWQTSELEHFLPCFHMVLVM